MSRTRFDRYRLLSAKLGEQPARELIDRLQVLALTEPQTLREMEKFLERGGTSAAQLGVHRIADRRQNPDRRRFVMIPPDERRRGPRRASEVSQAR